MLSERNQMHKKHVPCDHFYMKYKNRQTPFWCEKSGNQDSGSVGGGREGERGGEGGG